MEDIERLASLIDELKSIIKDFNVKLSEVSADAHKRLAIAKLNESIIKRLGND